MDTCARYLLNLKNYLHFNRYLEQGLPIATGVIEGACRHLVKDRMDVTGARWSFAGAEAVLRLWALRSSNDFDEYWMFHEHCEYE
ncbi:MAG: ISKra4 family transposase, partial [Pseudomonadota bacterium]